MKNKPKKYILEESNEFLINKKELDMRCINFKQNTTEKPKKEEKR